MSIIIPLIETSTKIDGFDQMTSSLTMGDLSLRARLLDQCRRLKISTSLSKEKSDQFCFYDNCVYSDSLLLQINKNFHQLNFVDLEIETTWNPAITFKLKKTESIKFSENNKSSIVISQKKLLSVDLNLPENVYPEKDYNVVATDIYFQKIETWKDLLIAQSLVAREFTSKNVQYWKPKFPHFISNWLFNNPTIARMTNKIGKNCRIHPTAVLESCVIGDNVEIGAFCYLRACVIGSKTTIREKSSLKLSVVGSGSYLLPTDVFNCYIGKNVTLTTPILFHCVIGDLTFIGGGVGFADLNASKNTIQIKTNGSATRVNSQHLFLGSCVAENCFIGAGLLFHVGQLIPHNTQILNYNMIRNNQFKSHKTYVSNHGKITQIPKSFLDSEKKDL